MRIIDLHCDTLTECHARNLDLANNETQLSVDRMTASGSWCQAMAVYIPDKLRGAAAADYFDEILAYYRTQLRKYGPGRLRRVYNVAQMDAAARDGVPGSFLTVEGGSVLAGELSRIPYLAECGVGMLTLTWNGANELGGGQAEDIGLTALGREALPLLERHNIIIDVSHLGDRAFWELLPLTRKPFVASHSNSRAICPHPRNLTDEQFAAIVERGGLVGLNFSLHFIGEGQSVQSMGQLAAHIEHFASLGGRDCIALGSDYDGTDMPEYLNRSEKLEKAMEAMVKSGLDCTLVEQICWRNARDFFLRYEAAGA